MCTSGTPIRHCTLHSGVFLRAPLSNQAAGGIFISTKEITTYTSMKKASTCSTSQKVLRRRIVAKQLFTRVAIELSELRGCCSNYHWKRIPCYNITAKQGQEVSTQRLLLARRRSTRNGNSTIFHNAVELSAVRPWQCKRIGDHNTSAQDGKYSPQIVR